MAGWSDYQFCGVCSDLSLHKQPSLLDICVLCDIQLLISLTHFFFSGPLGEGGGGEEGGDKLND